MGLGTFPCGRDNCGNANHGLSPQFNFSVPEDGVTGASIYQTVVRFGIYSFSSRIDPDSVKIEVSENGEVSYADAYVDGAFVAPYNGSESRVDDHQANSHGFGFIVHKASEWANDKEIVFKVTALDWGGQEILKTEVVRW